MRRVCEQGRQLVQFQESLYYLNENHIQNNQIVQDFTKDSLESQSILIEQINSMFVLTIITDLVVFTLLLTCVIPAVRKINKFQEVILFVISRTTYSEVDFEIERYKQYHESMVSLKRDWITFDFISSSMKDLANKKELNRSNFLQKSGSVNVIRQSEIKLNLQEKKKLAQQISSQIVSSKLNIFKYILLISIFSLTSIIFVSIAVGVCSNYQNQIKERLDLYNYNLNAVLSFNAILTLSEITIRKTVISKADKEFPFHNVEITKNTFLSALDSLNSYILYMNNHVQDISYLTNQEENSLKKILQSDLCELFEKEQPCQQQNESHVKSYFQQGFFSVLSAYQTFFHEYVELVKNDDLTEEQKIDIGNKYAQTEEYIHFIAQGFNIPSRTFNLLLETIESFYDDKIQAQKMFLLHYIILGGFIMYVLWFGFSFLFRIIIDLDLNAVKFLLTCIPFAKQQDETIIQVLKQINYI